MWAKTLFALGLVAASGAAAQEGPGSFARWSGQRSTGPIFVDAAYVARDGCQAIVSVRRAAPPGVRLDFRTVPVTAVVGPDPAGCGQSRVARRTFRVAGGPEPSLVEIFFVRPDGRLLKREKVSIGAN